MTPFDPRNFDSEVEREWRRFPPGVGVGLTDVALARERCREHFARVASRPTRPLRAGVTIEDVTVPSLIDDHAIPVRVYRPDEASGRGLLYIHGGAFVMGDLELEDECCYEWARQAQCVIVSVDYRLPPEHRYPVPLEDCYSALHWVVENAEQLAIDLERVGVGGCSAGGALAAGVSLLARDRRGPSLGLQMLLYPVLDATMGTESMQAVLDVIGPDQSLMWEHYLGAPPAEVPVYASPAHCQDLAGLPPAYIAVAALDPLRDEGIRYAQRLISAEVAVELHLWPGAPHAFELFVPDASVARRSLAEQADAISRFLEESARRRARSFTPTPSTTRGAIVAMPEA
jgi:acetyl esterase